MKKRSVMTTLGLVMTPTACGEESAGTITAPSSGSEIQAEAKAEGKAEGDTTAQKEDKKESKTEASGDTVTLELSNNQPDGNCTAITVEWFTDQVREHTGGRVNTEVYNNGTLGGAISYLEQLQYSGMGIVRTDLSTMTNFVGEYGTPMMPYIYRSAEHFWKVHGGDIGMGALRGGKIKGKKLYGLTHYDGGTRYFYNTKKEIHSPADMKNMLVRVQQSELVMSMVETLGSQSVATTYSEVHSALQVGVVDAAESLIVNYLGQSHFEVAPYFVEDHHTGSADVLVMGEKSRGKLSAEDLEIIDDTALKSREYQKELWVEAEKESEQKPLEQGVTITELIEEELKAFQDACEPIWCSYEGGACKGIIDQIVETDK